MNDAVPLVSNVSFLLPALTATVIEASYDPQVSVATFTPFSKTVTFVGLSNLRASGISPYGSSPKSVNLDLVN
jgi:hypothetical protein